MNVYTEPSILNVDIFHYQLNLRSLN